MALISCPYCAKQIKINNHSKLIGKRVRITCIATNCKKKFEYDVKDFNVEENTTVIMGDEPGIQNATLTIYNENTNFIDILELTEGVQIIGRKSSLNIDIPIPVEDKKMSRKHCAINGFLSKDKKQMLYTIEDTKSTNGVFLNGKKLQKEDVYYLEHGQNIIIGNTSIKFEYQ